MLEQSFEEGGERLEVGYLVKGGEGSKKHSKMKHRAEKELEIDRGKKASSQRNLCSKWKKKSPVKGEGTPPHQANFCLEKRVNVWGSYSVFANF